MRKINDVFLFAVICLSSQFAFADLPSDLGGSSSGSASQQAPATTPTAAPSPSSTPTPTSTPTILPSASPSPSSSPALGTPLNTSTTSLGTFLVNSEGRSLYIFEADTTGVSNCSGACAVAWPPLTVASGQIPSAGDGVTSSLIGTIQRSDGTTQVTYAGRPLYFFIGDASPGDTNGEGLNQFGALWFLVKPDGTNL